MRGLALYLHFTKEENAQARVLFQEAIRLDPAFARAYGLLAGTHRQDWTFAWTEDRQASVAEAYLQAQKALELARLEPSAPSL